jgi:hypothetical protein
MLTCLLLGLHVGFFFWVLVFVFDGLFWAVSLLGGPPLVNEASG